ncbi:MAG: cyclic di-GMP phosphodiesterase [Thermoleophilaceae bacterium]|nr:cyclic di-GMP phosphodiesterase [Thermoleophilaceae bacterium]
MKRAGRTYGLTTRLAITAAVAFAVVVAVFALLALSIARARQETDERQNAQRVSLAAQSLQTSVLDMETGVRAFLITRQDRFLDPWRAARDRRGGEEQRLLSGLARLDGAGGRGWAFGRRTVAGVESYFLDHSLPLVLEAQSGRLEQAVLGAEVSDGKQRVDELRKDFAEVLALETARASEEDASAAQAAKQSLILGIGGLILILATIVAGLAYLARNVTRPVVRVAQAASAIADGSDGHEPVSRNNSHAAREVQSLTDSFDAMAEIVRAQRDGLRRQNTMLERRVRERTGDLETARYEALLMLAVAAEYRDDDTHRHTQRVGRNAALVAEKLGLGAETIELLRVAAPLHDVGKIGVSDSILLKPGKLTPAEFEAMKQHVVIGESILGSSSEPIFHVAAEIARTHHERWDGTGYLDGLSGDQIPLAGRIVAVVDVFDALTHARPYKDAWPVERALEEIEAGAGAHFDPDVVGAFASIDPGVFGADVTVAT